MPADELNIAGVRERLAARHGRQYWRSLEEVAGTESFRRFLKAEFPQAAAIMDGVDRRQFLQLMGASLALAGLSGCTRQPREEIVPYVRAPENVIPGKPLYYATALPLGGASIGVLAESHMGRPTKIEGNPRHPASLGATDCTTQAAVLSLYDPDRSQVTTSAAEIRPWGGFLEAMRLALEAQRERGGAGFRILTETVTSPTLEQQLRELLAVLPEARWHRYDPLHRDSFRQGTRLAFARSVDAQCHFDRADVILALDADFMSGGAAHLRAVREFTRRRRVDSGADAEMNRLYVVEPTPTLTGAAADHRLPMRAGAIEGFARAVADALGVDVDPGSLDETQARWAAVVAEDLRRRSKRALVVAGEQQSPAVQALAHAMNAVLGSVGTTVDYTEPVEADAIEHLTSLRELVADVDAGKVEILLILGGNPVFTAPPDLRFTEALQQIPLRVHLSPYEDETSTHCHWHIPEAHPLESWSDVRAYDGTASIVQPLIEPLYEGKTAHDVLVALSDRPDRSSYEVVREHWRGRYPSLAAQSEAPSFEKFWRRALHDGVVSGTAAAKVNVGIRRDFGARLRQALAQNGEAGGLEILFRADAHVTDGRFANNGWLQELPRPMSRLTWDNAALLAPATAERLGVGNEDVIELRRDGRGVRAPVWIVPGQAPDSITLHLGYGRRRAGRVGNGVGFDAYPLRASSAPWFASGVQATRTGERHPLVTTQEHHSMEGRELVRVGTVEEYRQDSHFAHGAHHGPPPSLYPPVRYDGNAWGMSIDLSSCIGCNACTIACQAENNIPVVGKEQVANGREMHWIRVDRYYEGDLDNPATVHQPVPCMHCENAPCEVVCPVNATVHSSEGLNDMVYNRCVGTRYCSNNCPYKVRRFNFHLYSDWDTESVKLVRNPDVTVRSRGVMEKCTYCVQRINHARIEAKKEGREIGDGEIVTACQQVCPAEAIAFGNINDEKAEVSRRKASPLDYALLGEINTRPRTTYMARLKNPNPALPEVKEG
jgi:molybdopterin-containing oxidoreductase family iron-sulfur binding subunit